MALVSVIIPVYNASKTLEQTVKSIQNQTFLDWDLILVNDGSTDNSLEVCKIISADNKDKIIVIDKENGGVVSAYKKGILASSGKYIMFCDADDEYSTDFIENAVKIIQENNCDFVSFAATIIDSDGKSQVANAAPEGLYNDSEIKEKILPHCLFNEFNPSSYYKILVYRWNKIYTKELIMKFFDELDENCFQIEDNVFTTLAIVHSSSIFVSNKSFYNYYLQEKSITKGYDSSLFGRYLYSLGVLKKLTEKYLIDTNPFQFELLAYENFRIVFRRCAKSASYKICREIIKQIRESGYIKNIRNKNISLAKNKLFYFLYKLHLNFFLYLAFRVL